ncbi:MAG: hypothetical protein KDJ50_03215 [Alphaproteobacteria bacterium]|nr:hypothetical protein [Alphaproteobacteria bacterium]
MASTNKQIPELDKAWVAQVLEGMFAEPNKCVIVLPPEGRPLFDQWIEDYVWPSLNADKPNEDYDACAKFEGEYFAIRVTDTPEVRERIIAEMKLNENGIEFFIVHDPKKHQDLAEQFAIMTALQATHELVTANLDMARLPLLKRDL